MRKVTLAKFMTDTMGQLVELIEQLSALYKGEHIEFSYYIFSDGIQYGVKFKLYG